MKAKNVRATKKYSRYEYISVIGVDLSWSFWENTTENQKDQNQN